MPSPSASRRKDPAGAGSALPCPLLPGEAGLGAGAGAGVAAGGVDRRYKIEGGGGLAAHLVQLLGGCRVRAAPAGGCPRQGPDCVNSSSTAQVSPGSPPSKTGGCDGSREPRALPSGVCPGRAELESSPSPVGARRREGWCGQVPGPGAPFPRSSLSGTLPPLSAPVGQRDAPRGSCNFPETSARLGKLQRVPDARSAGCALAGHRGEAESYVNGASGCLPGSAAPSSLTVCRACTCAPTRPYAPSGPRSANSNAAVWGGAVGDAAVRG